MSDWKSDYEKNERKLQLARAEAHLDMAQSAIYKAKIAVEGVDPELAERIGIEALCDEVEAVSLVIWSAWLRVGEMSLVEARDEVAGRRAAMKALIEAA